MKKTIIAALGACAAAVAYAVDADTFAFYSFKDGAAGTSAVGVTLANQVDASKYAGTATCPDTDATASATFNADAPGLYVYSSRQMSFRDRFRMELQGRSTLALDLALTTMATTAGWTR